MGEIGMSRAADEEIVALSLERRAVLVTLGAAFPQSWPSLGHKVLP